MRMLRLYLLLFAIVGLSLSTGPVSAGGARPIPEALQPWVEWVRDGAPCPRVSGESSSEKVCAWPHRLLLEHASDKAGTRFQQQWQVFDEGWIPLPGDSASWPEAVRVNGQPAVVIARNHRPHVRAAKGRIEIEGLLAGHDGRRAISLPPGVALVQYRVDGRERPVYLDAGGKLRFSPRHLASQVLPAPEKDSLTLKVFRRFRDDVPTEITTVLRLVVSGREREVRFGKVTLPGAVPVRLQGPLRASIDESGELAAIVRPGTWELTVTAYYPRDRKRWERAPLKPSAHSGSCRKTPGSPSPLIERAGERVKNQACDNLREGGVSPADFWPHNEYWFFQREPALYATELSGST